MLNTVQSYVASFFQDDPKKGKQNESIPVEVEVFLRSREKVLNDPVKLIGSIQHQSEFLEAWDDLKEMNPNIRGLTGNSLLHLATLWGTKEHLIGLIERGALLDLKGADGQTALEMAKAQKNSKHARLLIKMGALNKSNRDCRFRLVTVIERGEEEQRLVLDRNTNDLYPNYNPLSMALFDTITDPISSAIEDNPCFMIFFPLYFIMIVPIMPFLFFIGILESFFVILTRPAHVISLIVLTPFFTLGVMFLNLVKLVSDIARIAINFVVADWLEKRDVFSELQVSIFYEIPKAFLTRIWRALVAPFYGLWMMKASLEFLSDPNQALVKLNKIEKAWDESGLLYALHMKTLGNLGTSKVNNLAQFRLKASIKDGRRPRAPC